MTVLDTSKEPLDEGVQQTLANQLWRVVVTWFAWGLFLLPLLAVVCVPLTVLCWACGARAGFGHVSFFDVYGLATGVVLLVMYARYAWKVLK